MRLCLLPACLLLLQLCCLAQAEENLCDTYGYLCANGGTCVKTDSAQYGYECRCAQGFYGILCRSANDICAAYAPCYNGGNCTVTSNGFFTCTCPEGIRGYLCHINIDDCEPNPCVHGVCVDRVNAYKCVCDPGYEGTNCEMDKNECSGSPCHANASCHNTVGSYTCTCNAGFYGDGHDCVEITVFPTTNSTRLLANDFNHYTISNITIESETPFLIGSKESFVCRISKDGYISFSDPPYQSRYPTYYKYLTKPMVYPYWSYRYGFAYADSGVHYELLERERHSDTENWRRTREAVRAFNGSRLDGSLNSSESGDYSTFEPLAVLIVTWRQMQPYNYYTYYCERYCMYYFRVRNYTWAEYYCKYCDAVKEHLTFQAVVTRNESHSLAIFNYGEFRLQRWRWRWFYTAAGFTDGYSQMQRLPFSYRWWRSWVQTDSLLPGNSGKRGRHIAVMATNAPPSAKLQCKRWISKDKEENKELTAKLTCNRCPRDMRQAVLDWRYWPYQYSCDRKSGKRERYQLSMCFRGRFECVQDFSDYTCPYRWSWWCRWTRCQFYHAARCCYKLNINWKRDGVLVDYCNAGYSIWELRWRLRREMFDRDRSGWLVKATKNGAGHSQLMRRSRSHWWWFSNYDEQLRSETHGYDMCRAARRFGKYKKRRPRCNSKNYTEPIWGFNRGDPHVSTLDGRTYSFNGLGEYYLLQNSSEEYQLLELQARTGPAQSLNPNVSSQATVFTGFGLKAGTNNVSVAMVMSSAKDDIDVFVDGVWIGSVLTNFSGRANATEVEGYSIKADDNSSVSVSEADTGFSISVTLSRQLGLLQATVQLDQDKHAGGVQGLLGNFNGVDTDDFRARNGTLLPANSSERLLFDFGQSWRLLPGDTSHLPYPPGKSAADFFNDSFVPVFVDEYKDNLLALFSNNSALLQDANTTCWHSEQSVYLSCMYDAAQLQTLSAAEEASLQARQEATAKAVAKNTPPQFDMPDNITVNSFSTFNITISVSDGEGNPVTLSVQSPGNDSSVWLDGSVLVWRVEELNSSTSLSVVATDSLGAPAEWQPVLLYCHCTNGGNCDFTHATTESGAGNTFYKANCDCVNGYQGDSCEVAPCAAVPNPCYNETMCHVAANGTQYCDACPAGMVGDGAICEDTNECLETPGICQEVCTNSVPGYECSCSTPGYQVSPSNSSLCVDIDECANGSHSCRADLNQTCVNTPGSYKCNCTAAGYVVNALGECDDVNECAASPCPSGQECVNTPGSYRCACAYGQLRQEGECKTVIVTDTGSGTASGNTKDVVIVAVSATVGGIVLIGIVAIIVAVVLRS